MSYWLIVTTKFSANQLLLRTNQICQSFAVIVFKFKDHRLLHKSHKVQTLAFSCKNFFLNGMMRLEREGRGHSFDYSWGSQELVGEKTFHDGSFNLIRDPRPLSSPTRIPRKLNKLHFQDSCVCTHYIQSAPPRPKKRKFAVFFLSAKKRKYIQRPSRSKIFCFPTLMHRWKKVKTVISSNKRKSL